ncbi:MAG: ATPase, T2SS/T4P/T4SS family [Planctomycetota bacterium]
MTRRFCWVLGFALMLVCVVLLGPLASVSVAQSDDELLELTNKIRPGGYLSILKIALIAVVFLLWVKLADWVNLDAMRFGKKSGLQPEIWNPIIVLCFLVAFLAVITVPFFWATYPVYVIATLLPPFLYIMTRRKRLRENASFARTVSKAKGGSGDVDVEEEVLPQDEGAEVEFSAAGADKNQKQSNLIRARQSGAFAQLKNLFHTAQFKRADQLLLDYTSNAVGVRILVDGTWHALEPMDRESGDAMLVSMKCLAGVNPMERRQKLAGMFAVKSEHGKAKLEFTSQGVPSGERALVKFVGNVQEAMPLDKLGMFPEMLEKVTTSMNSAGITVISAPPGQGFTSSWQGALLSSDRLTRDCIGLIQPSEEETRIENIVPKEYSPAAGESQSEVLRGVLLTQPDMIAVPHVEDSKTMDMLVDQANNQQRAILFRTPASSAAEALLRVYSQSTDRDGFLQAISAVTCQRLMRRLCPTCRVETRVQPQLIQQLGGNPKTQGTIFNQYQLPPPAQRVDEQGNPIEFPPCETCGGIGYIGRIAVYELIDVTDPLRNVIRTNPQPAAIEAAAVKLGKKSIAAQAYQLVLLGVTSLAEVQRVLKASK